LLLPRHDGRRLVVVEGVLALRPTRAEHVQADPARHSRQPAAEVVRGDQSAGGTRRIGTVTDQDGNVVGLLRP